MVTADNNIFNERLLKMLFNVLFHINNVQNDKMRFFYNFITIINFKHENTKDLEQSYVLHKIIRVILFSMSMQTLNIHESIIDSMHYSVTTYRTVSRAPPSYFWSDTFHRRVCIAVEFNQTIASS